MASVDEWMTQLKQTQRRPYPKAIATRYLCISVDSVNTWEKINEEDESAPTAYVTNLPLSAVILLKNL